MSNAIIQSGKNAAGIAMPPAALRQFRFPSFWRTTAFLCGLGLGLGGELFLLTLHLIAPNNSFASSLSDTATSAVTGCGKIVNGYVVVDKRTGLWSFRIESARDHAQDRHDATDKGQTSFPKAKLLYGCGNT